MKKILILLVFIISTSNASNWRNLGAENYTDRTQIMDVHGGWLVRTIIYKHVNPRRNPVAVDMVFIGDTRQNKNVEKE